MVEDDKDDQDFFLMALEGIENVTLYAVVNNGKEALERLREAIIFPDLIFSDINMPLMNGMEYLTEMIKNPKTKNIPIIMLTTDTKNGELAIKMGAKACMKKPTDETTFRSQLQRIISCVF